VKIDELTGAALDWAVAKCEGDNSVASCYYSEDNEPLCLEEAPEPLWEPTTNWAQAGPIIERERIGVDCLYAVITPSNQAGSWYAKDQNDGHMQTGPTPLIAAMRCYVASKLGDDVDIPKELT